MFATMMVFCICVFDTVHLLYLIFKQLFKLLEKLFVIHRMDFSLPEFGLLSKVMQYNIILLNKY